MFGLTLEQHARAGCLALADQKAPRWLRELYFLPNPYDTDTQAMRLLNADLDRLTPCQLRAEKTRVTVRLEAEACPMACSWLERRLRAVEDDLARRSERDENSARTPDSEEVARLKGGANG